MNWTSTFLLTFLNFALHVSESKIFTSMERGMSEYAKFSHNEPKLNVWRFYITFKFSLSISNNRSHTPFNIFQCWKANWLNENIEGNFFLQFDLNLKIINTNNISYYSYQSNIIMKKVVGRFSKLWVHDHLSYIVILIEKLL